MILFIYLGSILILSFRFQYFASLIPVRLNFFHALNITIVSLIVNYIAPFKTGSFIGKPLLIRSMTGSNVINSAMLTYLELMVDFSWQFALLILLILIAGISIITTAIIKKILIILILLIIILIVIKYIPSFLNYVFKKEFVLKLLPKRIRSRIQLMDFHEIMGFLLKHFYDWKFILAVLSITSLYMIIAPLSLKYILLLFGINFSYITIFLIFWISSILGRLSMIPGGIGVREASLVGLFYFYGIDSVTSLKIATMARLINVVAVFIFSLPFLLFTARKLGINYFKRNVKNKDGFRIDGANGSEKA